MENRGMWNTRAVLSPWLRLSKDHPPPWEGRAGGFDDLLHCALLMVANEGVVVRFF